MVYGQESTTASSREQFLKDREEKRQAIAARKQRSQAAPFITTDAGTGENLANLLSRVGVGDEEDVENPYQAEVDTPAPKNGKRQGTKKKVVRGPPRCASGARTQPKKQIKQEAKATPKKKRTAARGAPSCAATMHTPRPRSKENETPSLAGFGAGRSGTGDPAKARAIAARKEASEQARRKASATARRKQKKLQGTTNGIGSGKNKIRDGHTSSKVLAPPGGKTSISFY